MNEPLKITAQFDGAALTALAAFPHVIDHGLAFALDRAGLEVAREMKRAAPKAFTTLDNSIRMERDSAMSRWVGTGVNYALYVEKGTGPAAGQQSYFPNPVHLYAWVKFTSGIRFATTSPRTEDRKKQTDELRDRAWALARAIYKKGTRAQPFVAPTYTKMEPRVIALVREGIADSVALLAHGGMQ